MSDAVKEIMKILEDEKKIYEFILGRMSLQEQFIDAEKEPELIEVLDEKERAIDNLSEKDKRLELLASELPEKELVKVEKMTTALRAEIEKALNQILEMEEVCEKKIQSKGSRMGKKLSGLKKGKALLKGYNIPKRIKPKISKNI